MRSIAILQARTNSSRLPGKVLLPINGIPLAILAAKRAANSGREVIVATSCEPSDDALAEVIQQYGILCVRGSLDNTLQRFITALNGYEDDTLVFRLTADNVFPDGPLLDQIEQDFIRRGLNYICCNGEHSGLPYGVSAELTRARNLREAASKSLSKHDQEHVTPYIRRIYGEAYFEKYRSLAKGHLRCTVDCLDDYLAVLQVFSGIADPTKASMHDLISRLAKTPYQPVQATSARKLVLGTAQLGLHYGIANQTGQPDQITAEKLIKTAIANGATYIDTARAYGNSEKVIGNALKAGWEGRAQIITKLSPLTECPPDATTSSINAFVDASIYQSCSELRMQELDVLMLHRASHLTDWDGSIWKRLLNHKSSGTIKELGVSVQSPTELELALGIPEVSIIQMPYNLLDWRWDNLIPKIKHQKTLRPLIIHTRSALLQGLLSSTDSAHWINANVTQNSPIITWLSEQTGHTGSSSIAELCLNFVKSLEWIDGIVIGMESLPQLYDNVKTLCRDNLSPEAMDKIMKSRPRLEESTLNPAKWR